jgi:hypothetical protein
MAMARTHNGRVDEQISKAVVFSKYRNEGVGESFSHAKGNVGNSGKRASVLSNTNPFYLVYQTSLNSSQLTFATLHHRPSHGYFTIHLFSDVLMIMIYQPSKILPALIMAERIEIYNSATDSSLWSNPL